MTTKQGNIIIRNQSEAEQYRDVEKVGGYLYISSKAKLTAPNLNYNDGYSDAINYTNTQISTYLNKRLSDCYSQLANEIECYCGSDADK